MSKSLVLPAAVKPLYAVSIFLNAFLLFQVQPLIGKLILPWFGGVAAVWTVCLLFFQFALLLGYYYAHLLTQHFQPRTQGRIHAALLAASLFTLPILPRDTWKPAGPEHPAGSILLLLTVCIGLPYMLLSATSPLLQSWYALGKPAETPYRLYALSNAGSMLALVSYPLLMEPRLSSTHQGVVWSVAYVCAAALCAFIALNAYRTVAGRPSAAERWPEGQTGAGADPQSASPEWKTQALWMALAGCGSLLLVSITTHLTQNIAPVPLLWVIPLALYLLSFILCFESSGWYWRWIYLRLLGLALACMAYSLSLGTAELPLGLMVGLFCAGLFVGCMFCHGELARRKPDPAHLTSFYLRISLGSVLGALFAALVAPHLFSGYFELPVAIGACALLVPVAYRGDPDARAGQKGGQSQWIVMLALASILVASLVAVCVGLTSRPRLMVRNFYGVLCVIDEFAGGRLSLEGKTSSAALANQRTRKLMNGMIDHGLQFQAAERRREPTSYYGPNSGVGIALRAADRDHPKPLRVGLVGLGVGTLAAYGRAGDRYTFYEINPLDVKLARREFTFLSDSPATVDVIVGDARLSLER
ncbi:MAG TPA: hypothetical protein VMT24_04650, partial [Aggregatilineaceae bacterium]|nr:hypothetical protein [Aggregatilineaceae bacterium]